MAKGKMLVWSNPSSPEREAEFNEWYDSVHLEDVLKLEPFTSAARYKVAGEADTPGQYLAIYEVETTSFDDAMGALGKAFADGELPMSDCIAPGPLFFIEQV